MMEMQNSFRLMHIMSLRVIHANMKNLYKTNHIKGTKSAQN